MGLDQSIVEKPKGTRLSVAFVQGLVRATKSRVNATQAAKTIAYCMAVVPVRPPSAPNSASPNPAS